MYTFVLRLLIILCLLNCLPLTAQSEYSSFNNQISSIISGQWLDLSTGVMIEIDYPAQKLTRKYENMGEFRYTQTTAGMGFQFDSGEIEPFIEQGTLFLSLRHYMNNLRETVRIDYYADNYLEFYYIERHYKIALHRYFPAQAIDVNRNVHITSDPAGSAVYINGEYEGLTPLTLEIFWTNAYDRIELIFEKSGYITNRRLLSQEDDRIHMVLQPLGY